MAVFRPVGFILPGYSISLVVTSCAGMMMTRACKPLHRNPFPREKKKRTTGTPSASVEGQKGPRANNTGAGHANRNAESCSVFGKPPRCLSVFRHGPS